jgi:hypothetical protein
MRIVTSLAALALALPLSSPAFAAGKKKPPAPASAPAPADDDATLRIGRDATSSGPYALGRSLAAQGKCEAALDQFDEALRHTVDPQVFRDRGKCHDKLDHVFPAIDDFRAYLKGKPDAVDADRVRARLVELESGIPDDQRKVGVGGSYEFEMRGGAGAKGGESKSAPAETPADVAPEPVGDPTRPLREIELAERLAQERATSPLRDGKGPIAGLFVMGRYWGRDTFKASQTYGANLRYAMSKTSTVVGELGYVGVLSTGTASSMSGYGIMLGYEARFALDDASSNHFLLGAGLGYENVKQGASGLAFSSFLPRGRAGYRHVFGRAVALELAVDGGVAVTTPVKAPSDAGGTVVSPVAGVAVAFLVGF